MRQTLHPLDSLLLPRSTLESFSLLTGSWKPAFGTIAPRKDSLRLSSLKSIYISNWALLADCKPVSTPVAPNSQLSSNLGSLLADPTPYRQIVGALQYLTFTRPDISYAVNLACQFMQHPRDLHWQALKRIFRDLKGTLWPPTLLWTLWFNPFFSSKACFFYLPKFFITSIAAIWPDLYANHSFLTKPIRVKTSGKDWQESHWLGLKNESIYWWQYL